MSPNLHTPAFSANSLQGCLELLPLGCGAVLVVDEPLGLGERFAVGAAKAESRSRERPLDELCLELDPRLLE
jgi:hypothetical protein